MTSAQAKVDGQEVEVEGMILRKADIVSKEKTAMPTGPETGQAVVNGNPFEQHPGKKSKPLSIITTHILSDVNGLSMSPMDDGLGSGESSGTITNETESTTHIAPPPTQRMGLQRTYTDSSALDLQTKLYEALAQPYMEKDECPLSATSIGPRASIRNSSVHGHTSRYVPQSQAIFTTEPQEPWTILAANDMACLVFGVTMAEVRKIGIMEVVRKERREWLANKLNSGENTSTLFPYPHSHHGTPHSTSVIYQGTGRRVQSDVFYTGAGIPSNGGKCESGSNHKNSQSRGVILCGDVVPIQKRNGNTGAASLWVKEKRGGLIWVLEEINEDVALVYTSVGDNDVDYVRSAEGNVQNIFGKSEVGLKDSVLTNLLPTLPKKPAGRVDFDKTAEIHQFTIASSTGARIPCGVEPLLNGDGLRISTFPHIAGIIVLSASTLRIASTNAVFSAALLGHFNPIGLHITELIPNFDRIIDYLTKEERIRLVDGMTVPEHLLRKANAVLSWRNRNEEAISPFSAPTGLVARHRDGADIHVDVHMKVVISECSNSETFIADEHVDNSEVVYALWVTYSRHLHVVSSATDPLSLEHLRLASPPKRPSPGQPCTPVVGSNPQFEPPASALTKQLECIQQSPTPPSSEDELQESSTKSTKQAIQPRKVPGTIMNGRKKTISDFVILEDMGQGAYGQVKLARYKRKEGKRVVLKYVTKRRILVDTWTRDRRLGTVPLEIHVLDYLGRDGLRHPNIVEMTDFFEDDVNYYVEMVPHGLPGMDLFDYIELKVNMEEDECRSIFIQVARALHHLHIKAGVVHRDIKDENVVLDGAGNIKLIDFGSAAYIKNGPFDVFVGTIDYAAPEVLQGRSYKGKEQDVWALGVLLYTICYKENPFYNIDEIMDRELRIPFVTSEASLDLIKMMLDRDVERRPTIEQVLDHEWFEGLPGPEEALLAESPIHASTRTILN